VRLLVSVCLSLCVCVCVSVCVSVCVRVYCVMRELDKMAHQLLLLFHNCHTTSRCGGRNVVMWLHILHIHTQIRAHEDCGAGGVQAHRSRRRVTYGLPPEPGHRGAGLVCAGERGGVQEALGASVLLASGPVHSH
jgi:hypothetical protein